MITPAQLKVLRETYRPGSRVRLVYMNDPDPRCPVPGTLGTVRSVDDIGTIHVIWDHRSCLGVVYGEDRCELVAKEE